MQDIKISHLGTFKRMIQKKFGWFEAYKPFLVDLFSIPLLAPHANKRKQNLSVRNKSTVILLGCRLLGYVTLKNPLKIALAWKYLKINRFNSFKISNKKTSRKMHTFFIWQLLINIMKLFINEFCSYVSLRFLPQGLVTMSKRTYSAMLFSRSRYILKNWPTPGCHFSQITLMESIKSVWLKEKSAVKF